MAGTTIMTLLIAFNGVATSLIIGVCRSQYIGIFVIISQKTVSYWAYWAIMIDGLSTTGETITHKEQKNK